MLQEMGYRALTAGNQEQFSIQGVDLDGLVIFSSDEVMDELSFITVRTQTHTIVERISLYDLHQISDYLGGNAPGTDSSPGFTKIDLGFLSLGDNEELIVQYDYTGTEINNYIGCCASIVDIPVHDELTYHYQIHTDTSFNVDSCTALYAFASSISTMADLVSYKLGDDQHATTLRSTNWNANVSGHIETDNTKMGTVFESAVGQSVTVNTAASNVTFIARRVIQVDPVRARKTTDRIARKVVRKLNALDKQSVKAV